MRSIQRILDFRKINRKIHFHDKQINKKNEHNESTARTASYLLIANKSENEIKKLSVYSSCYSFIPGVFSQRNHIFIHDSLGNTFLLGTSLFQISSFSEKKTKNQKPKKTEKAKS